MQKLGMFSWYSYDLPVEERLRQIKSAGFDATSLWWSGDDKNELPDLSRKIGLELDNIHVPFNHVDEIWRDSLAGEDIYKSFCDAVFDCNQYNIPVAVYHITSFVTSAEISDIGMKRMRCLVDLAEKYQIVLAFENLTSLDVLEYVFDNIHSNHLGFCYDSGHENAFSPNANLLRKYGGRLVALHLNDNLGEHDAHLLPYDGNAYWDRIIVELAQARQVPVLSLEVDFTKKYRETEIYNGVSAQDYVITAYDKTVKIRNAIETVRQENMNL